MHMPLPIPDVADVAALLEGLIGLPVKVTYIDDEGLPAARPGAVATYVDDRGNLAAVALVDAAFLNNLGAAFVRVPARVAEEANTKGVVDEDLVENGYELLNVMARLLNRSGGTHVRLDGLLPSDALSDDVRRMASEPSRFDAYEVSVEGWGSGTFALRYHITL